MMRIHTPASDRRHRASAAPGTIGIDRKMRCCCTAAWCIRSNAASSRPHSLKFHERSSGSVAGSTPRSVATTSRRARV
jgi:hypothetical protein